jgi:two-component system, NarL family, response regulator LiaR
VIRLVIADRDHLMIQLLARLVDSQDDMQVTRTCTDEAALLNGVRAQQHDVILLDPQGLNSVNGELLTCVRAWDPDARMVVITASTSGADLFSAVRAGVRGYLSKSADVSDVLAAIRAAYQGVALLSRDMAAQLMDEFARQSYQETGLSPRQRDILTGLVQGKTNREIAADLSLSEKTVKNYMRSVFSALGCRDRTEAAIVGIRRGLVPATV